MPLDRTQAVPSLAVLGLNGSVLAAGLLAFRGGYNFADWSGVLQAVSLNVDGTPADVIWNAGAMLTDAAVTSPGHRIILTAATDAVGNVAAMAFEPASAFDAKETTGLMSPESGKSTADTLAARVGYLRGERVNEFDGVMRTRSSLLGAIINTQTVYVDDATGHYTDSWPTRIKNVSVPAPEMAAGAQTYQQFVADNAKRSPVVYIGANDGMLHAFNAPVPTCDAQGQCEVVAGAGKELWAYVPRAVYANLGNLTSKADFQYQPTVDATPVMRDVFFSEQGSHEWHTLLVGGVRLGGRGVYALDITHPTTVSEARPERTFLWEFDADATAGTSSTGETYYPADLGYTYGQPAMARLANGRWAVLIPSGYFPDCSKPDKPAHCEEAATQAPANDSALFVLDAQTGEVIRELKTPTHIDGVTSYGLTTPVLGDYNDDQVDDIAFAGDLAGNLWRFDLSAPDPSGWKITLAYRPVVQGAQPITVMPRLFADPHTHRFIVVFGTGKYLGVSDKSADIPVQSLYGIRDNVDSRGNPITVTRDSLQAQILRQVAVNDALLRNLTSEPLSQTARGWYIDLDVMAGERVVATPTALFNTGSVLFSTLIPDGDAPFGAVMAVDAATGGPGNTVSLGGISYVGGVTNQAHSMGSLPIATAVGGGKLILPGIHLKGGNDELKQPFSLGSPIWRRRSWSLLTPDY
ncbi:PilC/PilY family type IV pilus protein [Dyella sp. M7H15-1]|uniref:pilus assembly protein n=1 Tax=Dyella sp. M7H15-1 TaxID=2501295 RepID=UPI0013E8A822|nr:PilC/PilY family type IV pilus protein [Dyella sp. M7H15-1]